MTAPDQTTAKPLCHVVSPVGMLGYGVDQNHTNTALERLTATGTPTALILDSGSTDSGPQKLALGGMTVPRSSYVRDLRKLLTSSRRYRVPLIFSSAGGSGTDNVTRELIEVVRELAHEVGTGPGDLEIVSIFADIQRDVVKQRLRAGLITGCGSVVPPLSDADVDACPVIVAQMGPEPFLDALNDHPNLDVLIGGRAYDPAPFIAFAQHCYGKLGLDASPEDDSILVGGFTHMGKIMECAGLCAIPKGGGAVATVFVDGTFDISPMQPASACTPLSVAAHTLYEKSRPDKLYGPGGYLDLTLAEYTKHDDGRTVRVRGGQFFFSKQQSETKYQVKLEGAKAVGYRAMYVGAIKDPILLAQIDPFLERVRKYVVDEHEEPEDTWDLRWHAYGNKPRGGKATEICIIGEALAPTQELATSLVATAKVATIHGPYAGQKSTTGNLAHGIGGLYTVPLGPCAEFCVYHLMDLRDGEERGGPDAPLFRTETVIVTHQDGRLPRDTGINRKGSKSQEEENPLSNKNSPTATTIAPDPMKMAVLGDVARMVRSKNSGPYEITFDVIFEREDVFRAVKFANILGAEVVSRLYGIRPEQVVWSGFFDQALAYKATIPRSRNDRFVAAGGFMEDDVHGSQMYMPLLELQLPETLVLKLRGLLSAAGHTNEN